MVGGSGVSPAWPSFMLLKPRTQQHERRPLPSELDGNFTFRLTPPALPPDYPGQGVQHGTRIFIL